MDYSFLTKNTEAVFANIAGDPSELFVSLLSVALIIGVLIFFLVKTVRGNEKLRYEFITIIAHKFRTPLSQTKWALGELISTEQEPYIKQNMLELQKSNENLIRLTTTLIDLADSNGASKSLYHFETINLCQITRECGETMKDAFHEKNLFFSVQCGESEILVRGDRTRLEFAIQTIMENACIYSPLGRNVEIVVGRKGRKAMVSVADHGIGMNRIDLARLFSKFFRAKNAREMDTEGFGVGLFLARSVIRAHHGTIRAFSEGRDKGSTFTVTLPALKKKNVSRTSFG